jgi:hypothetical protein
MVNIRIKSNYRALEREIDRLDSLPNLKTKGFLDAVLASGFKMTQGAVHVVTGSLKGSGKSDSEIVGSKWIGEISYGGASLGINNPVTYAIYEKARDGEHDFFAPLKALDSMWVKAILRSLKN